MKLFVLLLHVLPRSWATALTRSLAWLAWILGVRRRFALENLAIAFPELTQKQRRALARRNYLHLGTCAAEFLRSPALSDEELFAMVEPTGWAKLQPFFEGKKGFIAATAHIGNFELFGVYGARRKVPLTILTRELKGGANANWVKNRTLAGIREIHKGMDNLVAAVNAGEALAVLIDQNMLLKRAVFVPFFGKLAATTPAPAVVAERTGAPVFLTMMIRKPEGTYEMCVEGPFHFERKSEDRAEDIRAFTAMLNDRFEHYVRQHPEQWFWMHRRWKTRPPEEQAGSEPARAAG